MYHKRGCYSDFSEMMKDLDALKQFTEGLWGQAVYAKEKTMLAHHRLKEDPLLLPMLFTQDKRYQRGRALIAFKDRSAVLSREEADFIYYQKLMSNKYADGSLSDRKKPQLFLTRDQLSNNNVKRVVAKFCRGFGSEPLSQEKTTEDKNLAGTNSNAQLPGKTSRWRKEVNDFVLGRFGKIYSPHNAKKKADLMLPPTLSSVRSEPDSPIYSSTPNPKSSPRFSQMSLSHLPNSPRRDIESLNIKHEIKKSHKDMVNHKLAMGYSKLRSIELIKLKSVSKTPYN